MDVSGTLHLYSGEDRELFFVFDDDVAQQLYSMPEFRIDEKESRRVLISVGADRRIHARTMSFSRKQTEIKVSLCSKGTKHGLRSLTALYEWYTRGRSHPKPFPVLGELRRANVNGKRIWELIIEEPVGRVDPPGLNRRRKSPSHTLRTWHQRRRIEDRDMRQFGRAAEALAHRICQAEYPSPRYSCLWRDEFLDSERIEIRRLGIIADIDVWDNENNVPAKLVEVKAQKVTGSRSDAKFYLSSAEWRTAVTCRTKRLPYELWVFQYKDVEDFRDDPTRIKRLVLKEIESDWLEPDGFFVHAPAGVGTYHAIGAI